MTRAAAIRPQDRAERINAGARQQAEALLKHVRPQIGLNEREQQLDLERAVCASEASLLRGHVHALCREVDNLERFMGAASEPNTYTCTAELYSRPVLLQYHVETDEDPSGRISPLVILDRANGMDVEVLDEAQRSTWESLCERDFKQRREDARMDAAFDRLESRLAA